MKKVMAFGTFDMLHAGHRKFLSEAKARGDFLEVVVARDATVEMLKGRRPADCEAMRLKNVSILPFVDKAALGSGGDDKYGIIREVRPDVICLGYDQKYFAERLEEKLGEMGVSCEIIRMKPFRPHEFKTSIIRRSKKKTERLKTLEQNDGYGKRGEGKIRESRQGCGRNKAGA